MSDTKGRDFWDKAPAVATFFLGVVGTFATFVLSRQAEISRVTQATVQMMSQREVSEMAFRERMFDTLLRELLNPRSSMENRLTTLRLFQLNFHDTFNGRAFFDVLRTEASKASPARRRRLLDDLNSLGRRTSELQESIVEASVGERFPSFRIALGEPQSQLITLGIRHEDEVRQTGSDPADLGSVHFARHKGCDLDSAQHVGHGAREHIHPFCVTLDSLTSDSVRVRLRFYGPEFERDSVGLQRRFWVSFSDSPFSDNTILPDRHRLAFVLKATDSSDAVLKVIEFPAGYIIAGYRPSLDQLDPLVAGRSAVRH